MDIRMWDSPASCIQTAKASGYHVVATHFDPGAVSIHDVDWTQPTAVILGNEREGDSKYKARHSCHRRDSVCANKLLVHPRTSCFRPCCYSKIAHSLSFLCYLVQCGCAAALCIFGGHLHLPAMLPSDNLTLQCCPLQHAWCICCMLVKLTVLWQSSPSERVSVWFLRVSV